MPDGEDKECSGIEDPEKMSEEEKEDVSQKVGEAIEIGNKKAEEEKAAADAKKTKKGKTARLSLPVFRLLIYGGLFLPFPCPTITFILLLKSFPAFLIHPCIFDSLVT